MNIPIYLSLSPSLPPTYNHTVVAALAATAACIVFICLPVILIMISIPLSKKRKRLYNLGYITDHEALKQVT